MNMNKWMVVWGILALVLAGCAAASYSPTPTFPAVAYDTAVAYHSTVIAQAIRNSKLNYAFVPFVNNAGCASFQASVEIMPEKTTLAVNDTLKVTVVLRNTGCNDLGMPSFQIQPRKMEALAYVSPEVQTHSGAIAPGGEDTVEFLFTAKTPGHVELVAQADFELHLWSPTPSSGTPVATPAWMWRQALSTPVMITVK